MFYSITASISIPQLQTELYQQFAKIIINGHPMSPCTHDLNHPVHIKIISKLLLLSVTRSLIPTVQYKTSRYKVFFLENIPYMYSTNKTTYNRIPQTEEAI